MDKHARKKLRESLKADGLVETLVWNKRTGVLIGGHQRLALMDEDHGGTDYSLEVTAVDLDEARERALNVRLNNMGLAGNYDFAALEKLFVDTLVPLDKSLTGFDAMDLAAMFPEQDVPNLFDPTKDKALGELNEFKGEFGAKPNEEGKPEELVPGLSDEELRKWRSDRRAGAESSKTGDDNNGFYLVFVADGPEIVDRFLKASSLPEGERMHDLRRLANLMSIDLDAR